MLTKRAAAICRSIAANTRAARLRRGWTQEQLGEAADVAPRYIQRIETGRINPSAVVVAAIADALGIDPGRLFRPAKISERREGRPSKRHPRSR
jgi:transcriptional regulator with XRE-family HTH domain